jgi:hypothetical protein
MAPPRERRGKKRIKRNVTRVSAMQFWRDVARLLQTSGASVFAVALPFGMASIGLEQLLLGLSPRVIKDQRAAAILAFYGSMAVAYVAYAAIVAVALPRWARATANPVRISPFRTRHLLSVLIIALVAPLGTIAGLAAAVIPGIVVWLSWVLAAPLAAATGEGPLKAMRRSARLTWGSRRSLFYVFASVQVSVLVLSGLSAAAMGQPVWAPLDDAKPLTASESLLGGLIECLQIAVSGAVYCAAYARLVKSET